MNFETFERFNVILSRDLIYLHHFYCHKHTLYITDILLALLQKDKS